MFVVEAVTSDVDHGCERDADCSTCGRDAWDAVGCQLAGENREGGNEGGIQPVNNLVVREAEYEFVNHTIDTCCTAEQLEFCVFRVAEDKMVPVESSQSFSSNTTSHLDFVRKKFDLTR